MERFSLLRFLLEPNVPKERDDGMTPEEALRRRRKKRFQMGFIVLLSLCLVTASMAFQQMVIWPKFGLVPLVLAYGAIVLWIVGYSRRGMPAGCASLLLFVLVTMIFFAGLLANPRQKHTEYRSPGGKHTVITETDAADRPAVYLKRGIFMTPLLDESLMPYYNETLASWVHWVDDDCFVLITGSEEAWIYSIDARTRQAASWTWADGEGYTVLVDGQVFCQIAG